MRVRISDKLVGDNSPVFTIAEAGINHNGSLKIAKKLIDKAKEARADAIKFQTFKADDLCSVDSKYYKTFKKLELSENGFRELSDYAKGLGIIFFSTPFSNGAVDLLEELKVPAYKIASGDLTDLPLIKHVASKKKPIIISTGMANLDEVRIAVKTVLSVHNTRIILMHSTSTYPTPIHYANLNAIRTLMKNFQYPIGYSDNGSDMLVPIISVAVGAKIIEKHFTLDRKLPGPDHKISADPIQFRNLIKTIRNVERMLGDGIKKCQPTEKKDKSYVRRSITAKMDIEKGSEITEQMIDLKRPATGIEPRYFNKVVGRKTKRRIPTDKPLKWEYLA